MSSLITISSLPSPHLHILDLPLEILLQILKSVESHSELRSLYRTSKTFYSLYDSNQTTLYTILSHCCFPPEAINLLNCLRPNALSPFQQERMVLCLNDVNPSKLLIDEAERAVDTNTQPVPTASESLDWADFFSGTEDTNELRLHPNPNIFRKREFHALCIQYTALVKPYNLKFTRATSSDDALETFFYNVHGLEVPARLPRAPASQTELARMETAIYNLARLLQHFHTAVPEVDEAEGEYKLDGSEISVAKSDGLPLIDDTREPPYAHPDVMVLDAKGVIQSLEIEDHMHIASALYFFKQRHLTWAAHEGYIYLLNEILADRMINIDLLAAEEREDAYVDLSEAVDFSIWDQFQSNVELWADRARDLKNYGYPEGFNRLRYMVVQGKAWAMEGGEVVGRETEMWIPDHPAFHGANMFPWWDEEMDLLEESDDDSEEELGDLLEEGEGGSGEEEEGEDDGGEEGGDL